MSSSSCICFRSPLNVFSTVSPHDPDHDQTIIHIAFKGLVDAHEAYHVDRHIGT